MRNIHLGLSHEARMSSVDLLNHALANESILLIKTKKAHWDIVGPQFLTLHKLWDEQYTTIAEYADEIAERARMLGGVPLGTAAGFLAHTVLTENPGEMTSASGSVAMLLVDHEAIARALRTAIRTAADKIDDAGTADFLTGILEGHEKMAWMLRSFLEGEAVHSDGGIRPHNVPNLA